MRTDRRPRARYIAADNPAKLPPMMMASSRMSILQTMILALDSLLDGLGEVRHALLTCLGERCERHHRAVAGDARPADSEGRLAGPAARLRHPAPHPADLARSAADPAGLALPGAVSPRAAGADRFRVGRVREQAEGEVLPPHHGWTATLQGRDGVLAAILRGDGVRARSDAGGRMNVMVRVKSWLRITRRRAEFERDMKAEMRSHLECYEADLRRRGVPDAEARRRALAEFGGVQARMEECRDAVGLRLVDELRGDVSYAFRLLRRSPAFTVVALLSLGLGIGANTAIFSLIDTVLVKTLPVEDPQGLFFVDNSGGKSGGSSGPPYPCFERLRDHNRFLSHIAAFEQRMFKVSIDGNPERLRGQYASGSYFDLLGVRAAHGRLLTPADDSAPGRGGPDGAVAVISDGFWMRRFGRNPAVLGKSVQVGTQWVTIVGVTPPDFFGLQVGMPLDITLPMMLVPEGLQSKQSWWLSVIARLAPDATVEQARADLESLWDTYLTEVGMPRERRGYFSGVALVPAARGANELRRAYSEP